MTDGLEMFTIILNEMKKMREQLGEINKEVCLLKGEVGRLREGLQDQTWIKKQNLLIEKIEEKIEKLNETLKKERVAGLPIGKNDAMHKMEADDWGGGNRIHLSMETDNSSPDPGAIQNVDGSWNQGGGNRIHLSMETDNSSPDKITDPGAIQNIAGSWNQDDKSLAPAGTQNIIDNLDQSESQRQNIVYHRNKDFASEVNSEYERFELDFKSKSIECSLVMEQNTPNLPKQYSRVCYAREDLIVESGVPFGSELSQHLGKLLQQGRREGSVAVIREENNYLYCLIIKGPTTSATPHSVFSAIQQLRDHASLNRVKKLVIPKMDTGDASFDWSTIKYMYQFLLGKRNIEITIAPFPNVYNVESLNGRHKNKIVHSKCSIHQMKKKSVIIYLTAVDGHFSEEMLGLDKKFDFAIEYRKRRKFLGDVIPFKQNEDHVLMGCIVKNRHTDPIDFESLWKCVSAVNTRNKNEKLSHVCIQAVPDQTDASVNFKIATVLYNNLEDVRITMCWPGSLQSSMPQNKS